MPRSALAHAISALESSAAKNGQSRSISRTRSSPWAATALSSAVPSPYQAGSTMRACVQEKTHGIARRSSIPGASPRLAGREPSRRREISSIGVAASKNAGKPGSS